MRRRARVRVRLGNEFLRPAAEDFSRIHVALGISGDLMHAPCCARVGTIPAEHCFNVAPKVEFHELLVVAVVAPEMLIAAHRKRVAVAAWPFVEKDAVLVEHLDAPVEAVRHIDAAIVAHGDSVGHRELSIALARLQRPPPEQRRPILVELHDSTVRIAVADEERTIREPVDHRRSIEVLQVVVGSEDAHLAEREHLRLAVVRELVDDVVHVIDHPDVPLWIVRLDVNLMRTAAAFEQVVPLFPRFNQLALPIDDEDGVAEDGHFARGAATVQCAPVARKVRSDSRVLRQLDLSTADEEHLVR